MEAQNATLLGFRGLGVWAFGGLGALGCRVERLNKILRLPGIWLSRQSLIHPSDYAAIVISNNNSNNNSNTLSE